MSDLIDTTEMYLKTVFELEEEGVVPMRARIAERLGHSGPTVSQTVARMERDGLLHLEEGRRIQLSETGREKADRKSTRLNSSHVAISYAVFCLKKKNRQTLRDMTV